MTKLFTQRKFNSLSVEQQHKYCAVLMRHLYDAVLKNVAYENLLKQLNLYLTWLGLEEIGEITFELLSNRYHFHLSQSKKFLKEENFLEKVTKSDKTGAAAPLLPIAIYLDNIRSAHNIGSIIRTTEAFSLGKLYFSENMAFIDHKQVQKTSMNCVKHVQCEKTNCLKNLPRPYIAMETSEEGISLFDFIFPTSFTLIVGNEEYGCSEKILSQVDHLVTIPMRGRKNSLNVANAFSIAAYEISRQHTIGDPCQMTKKS